MISIDRQNKHIYISNAKISIECSYHSGFQLDLWKHYSMPNLSLGLDAVFELDIEGDFVSIVEMEVLDIEQFNDDIQESLCIELLDKTRNIKSRLSFILEQNHDIRFILQFAAVWENGIPKETFLRLPFLASFKVSDNENRYYFPANPVSKCDETSVIQQHTDFLLPLGVFDETGQKGFALEFPILDEPLFVWAQNRNMELSNIKSLAELVNHQVLIRPNHMLTDIIEINCKAIDNGWPELFNSWRQKARERFDLSEYARKDLEWSTDVLLHHFTYVFGKEVYNYESNQLDILGLIDQGNEFGGYDTILIWHQYPRLGVDQRTQWDFFEDFPGGIQGLKKVVDQSHENGVRVLLPFKPWDTAYTESPKDATDKIAELIRKTDIDGIFFDTMDSVPLNFREAIDRVKPGVLFISEKHPYRKENIKLLTSSWDQYWNSMPMPEIDLLRYVLPEHPSPIIARWHVGIKKDALIKRAIFNGTGIVIWQDVFGSWLPYSTKQKEEIKRWKEVWNENKSIYKGLHPIPLYPTLQDGLYCNLFVNNDGNEIIYSLYNDTSEQIDGELLIHPYDFKKIKNVWNDASFSFSTKQSINRVQGSIKPKGLAIIKVFI